MNKLLYTVFGLYLYSKINLVEAIVDCPLGICKIQDSSLSNGHSADLIKSVDNMLGYLVGLLYFVAVIVGIYGGFLILVSGGDDEKVKKGKNYIIFMVIGLILIFLASIIVNWIIKLNTEVIQ